MNTTYPRQILNGGTMVFVPKTEDIEEFKNTILGWSVKSEEISKP